jgi:hypothetical protein
MKHKMRTLQGQFKSLLKLNADLSSLLKEERKLTSTLHREYYSAIKGACSITRDEDFSVVTVRVSLTDLKEARVREDVLKHICEDVSRKAGWIK